MEKLQSEDFEIPSSQVEQIITDRESTNQVLEVGEFIKDGVEFSIDQDQIGSFLENFRNRVLGTDPPVNFGHNRSGEAAGWIKDLFTDPSKTKLFAVIKWTASGLEALAGRTWRYLSAEFTNRFIDGSTGKQFGPTLAGAALTNVPFLRHMPAVVGMSNELGSIILKQDSQHSNEGDDEMATKEDVISLADHNAAIKVLTDANEKLKDDVAQYKKLADEHHGLKSKNEELTKKLCEMTSEIEQGKRKLEFEKLLSEGKACEAQREAFMSQNMDEFIKLAQPINLDGVGHGNDDNSDAEKFEDLPKGEQKLFHEELASTGMKKEDYMKYRKVPVQILRQDKDEE